MEWASQHERQRHEHGTQSVTTEERNAILFFREQVGDLKLLPEVVRHWRSTAAEAIESAKVADAVDRFLDWRQHQGRWNLSTAEDTRSRLSIFKTAFSDKFIHQLMPADLLEFLAIRDAPWNSAQILQQAAAAVPVRQVASVPSNQSSGEPPAADHGISGDRDLFAVRSSSHAQGR